MKKIGYLGNHNAWGKTRRVFRAVP